MAKKKSDRGSKKTVVELTPEELIPVVGGAKCWDSGQRWRSVAQRRQPAPSLGSGAAAMRSTCRESPPPRRHTADTYASHTDRNESA